MAGWPGGRVAGWPGGRVAGWPGGRVAGWPGGRVAGWPGGRVAGWPGGRIVAGHVLVLPAFSASAILLVCAGLFPADAAAQNPVYVPNDWALKPTDIDRNEKFRLLFVTSGKHDAEKTDINVYNTFVQNQVRNGGHSAFEQLGTPNLDVLAGKFRVLGSTETVSARSNTGTTGSGGVPIYWVGGEKVADDYRDFWDGSWDSRESRNQGGDEIDTSITGNQYAFTGSTLAGEIHTSSPLGGGPALVRVWGLESVPGPHGTTATAKGIPHVFYALSPVFQVKGTVDLVAEVAETTEGTDDFDKKLVARIVVQPSPTLTNPVWLSYYLSDDETSDFLLPYQEAKQSYTFFHGSRRFLINTQVDPFTDVDGTITMEMKKSDLPPGYEFKGDKDSNKKLNIHRKKRSHGHPSRPQHRGGENGC